ncbi:MAG: hypothetical protein ACJAZO_004523 [Myxococcota bacterium]|jgi:hypothetical protein
MYRLFAIASALTFAACSERGISSIAPEAEALEPVIQLDPESIDFGLLQPGDEAMQTVTVTNIGEDVLNLTGWVYEGNDSFAFPDIDALPERLEINQAAAFQVRYSPLLTGELGGTLYIESDDPENAQASVVLTGQGSGPALVISPDPYDFNSVFVGCGEDVELTLANVGDADLRIDALNMDSVDGQFSLDTGIVLPLTLPPGANTNITVAFDALYSGTTDGLLEVLSTDPRGVITATQLAEGTYAGQRVDSFSMPEDPAVDILFAVDQSCSMDALSANLASNFSTFISTLGQVTNNWQIGVITLENGCRNDTVFTSTTTNLNDRFSSAVGQGGHHATTEQLFVLTQTALAKTLPGQCNSGLLRDDALLHVVLVSDEYEQSSVSAGTFVTSVWSYRPSPRDVRISGIMCPASGCPTGGSDGTNSGYSQAVLQGGGEPININTNNWGASAQTLAEASVDGVGRFELSGTPDIGSLTVRVNGTVEEAGWYFSVTTNEVVFDDFPPTGAEIEVTYGLRISCP